MALNPESFTRNFHSLEELADSISRALDCAVTIEDANHKLIAYSSHHEETDAARISTIVSRRVPEKIIQTLWREGVFQRIMASEGPVRISAIEQIGLGDRVAIAIRRNHEILGYIWLMESYSQLDETATIQLTQAAAAASTMLLQMKLKHLREEQNFQDFFWQLLTGMHKSVDEIMSAAEKNKLRLPASFCIHVIRFSTEISDKLAQQLRYIISTAFRHRLLLYTMNLDQFILLENKSMEAASLSSSPVFTLISEMLKTRFGVVPEAGGCGLVYDDYMKVAASYHEALIVIQMKEHFPQQLRDKLHYEELGFYQFLPVIQKEMRAHHRTYAALRKLEQYDLKQNSNLTSTLRTYLQYNSSLKETAAALHIHENTLNYRLKRIAEVGHIDLTSMDEKVTCYLELKLRELEK